MSKYYVELGVKHWEVYGDVIEADSEEEAFEKYRKMAINEAGKKGLADETVIQYRLELKHE